MNTLTERITNYFKENENEYNQLVSERMSYNGWHQDDEIYEMSMLSELFQGDFDNLMNRIYFGHDNENGDKSSFNPNRNYFYFNGYGNLISTDYLDYSEFMYELVEDLISGELEDSYFTIPDEVQEMLNELEEGGNENE